MSETFDSATTNPGSGGTNIAGDSFVQTATSIFVPACYLVYGPAGGPYERVDTGTGLPVSIAGTVAVSGPLTDTQLRASAVPVSLASVPSHNVTNAGTFAVQAAQSGTWTITGAGGTFPVTGTFWQATQPVSIAGTVAVSGPLTDTQLRASAVPVSLASVPSHNVTNAGTFAVQAAQSGTWTVTGAGGTFPVTGTFWQATQPVSGTFWQATQPVSIAATVTVDTELSAAAALADATSNPTTALVGSCAHVFNGSTWDRVRGAQEVTVMSSASRSGDQGSADQTNYSARGVYLYVDVTVVAGGGQTIGIYLQGKDPISGNYVYLSTTPTLISATGTYGFEFSPGATGGTAAGAGVTSNRFSIALPRTWRVWIDFSGAGSFTFSIGASYLP